MFLNVDSVRAQGGVLISARVASVCGNSIIEFEEVCDNGANNGNYGYCKSDCSGLGLRCGDGILQSAQGEQCDGADLAGKGCSSFAYTGGTLSCKADCTFNVSQCTSAPPPSDGGGGGGWTPPPVETKVVLQGKAYASAKITILKDGQVTGISAADTQANFKVTLSVLSAGTYTFGIWAEDKDGRKSITFSFTVNVASVGTTTTISGIFIPPTIELSQNVLKRGEKLDILGQTAPKSDISVHIESSKELIREVKADSKGDWLYSFWTEVLDEGSHTAKAKAKNPDGLLSSFSAVMAFQLGKVGIDEQCPRADLNRDGKVNLIDFSILLYWWGRINICSDQNRSGKVDLPDFSIMLFWWTG